MNIYQSSLQHLKPDYYTTKKAMSASNLESLILVAVQKIDHIDYVNVFV